MGTVLEPAAYGVPVIFGPRHQGSRDAAMLLAAGAAKVVRNQQEIVAVLRHWIEDVAARGAAGSAAGRVVAANAGATAQSVALIEALLEARAPRTTER